MTTTAVAIRAATTADAPSIAAIYRPYVEDSVISFEEVAPSAVEIAARMTAAALPWLVAVGESGVVGYAYAGPHRSRAAYRWAVDVSVYLAAAGKRRGTGRALYTQLFSLLRDLGYVRAYAGITLPNPASVGLHEAMGFTLVGVYHRVGFKNGAWHDVGWWQLSIAAETDGPPPEPRPWTSRTEST